MRFVSKTRRNIARVIVAAALVLLILLLLAWRPAIEPIEPPAASLFDSALIHRGAELAALGDCATCHTAPGHPSFAGGRAIPTPFGTIYSTNITPDPTTGIGRWPQGAFARALREGVDRRGRHLFPAFPYDHFTLLDDEDIAALYAFFMTRKRTNTLMAGYVVAGMNAKAASHAGGASIPNTDGARIYAAACASCHDAGQPLPIGAINLSLSTDVSGEDPTNLIRVVLDGLQPADEARQPVMPGFRKTLSDPQLLALLSYLRTRFAQKALWPGAAGIVRRNTQ